jgi:hypothetical protein
MKQLSQNWMSTRDFSAKCGVTQWTVRRWVKAGKVTAMRFPPGPRGRIFVLDPGWSLIDRPNSDDPSEWVCVLRQRDVAMLLNITPRWLRHLESTGKAHYRLVGHRKRYSLQEVRRLIADRTLGHNPRSRQEANMGMLRWAFQKLGLRTHDFVDCKSEILECRFGSSAMQA